MIADLVAAHRERLPEGHVRIRKRFIVSSGRKSAAARRRSQHSHPLAGAEPFVFNFDFDVVALF
jgi:hypothetical protein